MDRAAEQTSNPLFAGDPLSSFGAIEPHHVRPAVREVLEAERSELDRLAAVDEPSIEWLCETERLLERVHDVWNPVSHLNGVASSPELREAYNDCLAAITEFYSDLGLNEALYARFEKLGETVGSEPEAELIRQSLREFRLAGVALTGEARQAYREVSLELAKKQAEFEQHLMDATDAFSHHETDAENLSGLPPEVLERARAAAIEQGQDGWLLKLDPPTYQSVMTHADSPGLRETYYRAWVTRASDLGPADWDNGPLIEDILRLRQRSAELLGFDNFADLSLARKMAKSGRQVIEFLEDLAIRSRPMAERELSGLESFAGRKLEAWDIAYYSEKLRQRTLKIGGEELRAYFPVPKVLAGLFDLAERLFGIRISEQPGLELWHPTASAFRLANADGSPVGMLLTDFYARPNKRGGAWMDNCVNRSRLGSLKRQPIAHLVCNFAPKASEAPPPKASAAPPSQASQASQASEAPPAAPPSYITHDDVVTLFHEFGHALHHLLTEIDYPSIAGINGVAWDAVELPSQFFENYAWQPEVLRSISAHRDTGEPIPEEKIRTLIASRTFHSGLAMLRQLEFALFDFRLHTRAVPARLEEVQSLLDEVRTAVAVVQVPDFNRFQCSFTHIFAGGYAAGYYSYKWAEVLAADAFSAFAEPGPFDATTAGRFRRDVLAVGGSRDAMESFVAFRGREPELDPLLRQSGLIE